MHVQGVYMVCTHSVYRVHCEPLHTWPITRSSPPVCAIPSATAYKATTVNTPLLEKPVVPSASVMILRGIVDRCDAWMHDEHVRLLAIPCCHVQRAKASKNQIRSNLGGEAGLLEVAAGCVVPPKFDAGGTQISLDDGAITYQIKSHNDDAYDERDGDKVSLPSHRCRLRSGSGLL